MRVRSWVEIDGHKEARKGTKRKRVSSSLWAAFSGREDLGERRGFLSSQDINVSGKPEIGRGLVERCVTGWEILRSFSLLICGLLVQSKNSNSGNMEM